MARISFVLLLFAMALAAQTQRKAAPKASPPPTQTANPPAAAPTTPRDFTIDSIAIDGNRILTGRGIIAASGLAQGAKGDVAIFDAARDRLLATGYFETVAYTYRPTSTGGYAVTIEVEEIAQRFPLRVEGFETTTAEVIAALKTSDPLFTGTIPGTQQVLTRTAREIEEYLGSKNQRAQVVGKMIATAPGQFEIDFTPRSGLPVVAMVTFDGNKLINSVTLQNKIAEVAFGQPFTETSFRILLDNQIRPLYETKGHLHVVFGKITTEASSRVKGIDVKVAIDEGAEYKLTRVAVAGKAASESTRILKAAKIPQMTIANFDEIKTAATRVKEAMRHQGYLDTTVTTDRKVNDADKTAEFFLVVDLGTLYTMGTLSVNGLGLDGEAAIRKMWGVKPGDAYPAEYPDYFVTQVKEEGLFDNFGGAKAVPKINAETHVVDVTLDFQGAPADLRGRGRGRGPGR